MITLLLGGVRSGKSALAVELGRRHAGPVVFVATCPIVDGDDDLAMRIERHRGTRPEWPTVEAPVELVAAVERVDDDSLLLVDCLTLWVSNLMYRGDDEPAVTAAGAAFAGALLDRSGDAVVASNEVGSGVHPEGELGRRYRDLLGRVNQLVAAAADTTLLVVAGRTLRLEDPWELLG
jgi:adenosyl cobinamide kinase/adenosyl cobinamide phosphate guanylyltransferase